MINTFKKSPKEIMQTPFALGDGASGCKEFLIAPMCLKAGVICCP